MTINVHLPLWLVVAGLWSFGGLAFAQLMVSTEARLDPYIKRIASKTVRYTLMALAGVLSGPVVWLLLAHDTPERLWTLAVIPNRLVLYRSRRRGGHRAVGWPLPVFYRDGKLRLGTRRTGVIVIIHASQPVVEQTRAA